MIAVCLSLPRTAFSWGFETSRRSPKSATLTLLQSRSPSVETNSPVESYHFDIGSVLNQSYVLGEFSFLRERAEELSTEAFGDGLNDHYDTCSGPYCEECQIPEEWKTHGSEDQIDVMEFLGIRRAKPILSASIDME